MSIDTKLLSAQNPDDLMIAAEILKSGDIVALPTETVYGLAANAYSATAIAKVFAAKKRPHNNPLILHVHDLESAYKLFDWSLMNQKALERFLKLAKHFWPGPLTLVAKKQAFIPEEATAGLDSVAVRIPKSIPSLAILKMLNFPLVMPSANLSTRPSPTCASHVFKTLAGRIAGVLDDGSSPLGIESSVVRFDSDQALLLRLGSINANTISSILGEKLIIPESHNAQPQAPGQAYLHYAPQVRELKIINKLEAEPLWANLNSIIGRRQDLDYLSKKLGPRRPELLSLALGNNPETYAAGLYHALYRCEEQASLAVLLISPPSDSNEWAAVMDRINRAAGIKIKPL